MSSELATGSAAATGQPGPVAQGRSARTLLVIAIVVLAAIAIRLVFFSRVSGDYLTFDQWYSYIKAHGGFRALKDNFANYNEPYLYLLAMVSYIPVSPLVGIKVMSVLFDFLLAFFAYRIVDLRYPGRWWPILAGAIVLFLPTVVMNSSWWAQADAMYSAFAVGGVYFLLRRRPYLACLFFGLSFAFKLQAVFLFPLLLLVVLRKQVPWRALLLIPAVYLISDVPALLVGASPSTVLSVYVSQTDTYSELTLNAPNIYQFFSTNESSVLRIGGILVTGALLLGLIGLAVARGATMTPAQIVLAGTVSVLLAPFFLPAMHERYFYLADILTVLSAFYLPRRLLALPVLEQFASAFSYLPFLLMTGGGFGRGTGRARLPGGSRPGGGLPGGRFRGGTPGQALPSGGTGGGGGFRGGFGGGSGGTPGGGRGGFAGIPTDTVVSFKILAATMALALVLAVWAAFREFLAQPDNS